jgi:hypothetical protein
MNEKEKKVFIDGIKNLNGSSNSDSKLNSWERVAELRSNLKTNTSDYPWKESVEELWEEVSYSQKDDLIGISREDCRGNSPLEALFSDSEIPRYPPMEVIIAIQEAFSVYMCAGGKLTLEEVFFGKLKKGVGNYSARTKLLKSYEAFDNYVRNGDLFSVSNIDKKKYEQMNLEDKAVEFLAHREMFPSMSTYNKVNVDYENIKDPESYLRGYRRWKRTSKGV